jgi:predicted membrane protein
MRMFKKTLVSLVLFVVLLLTINVLHFRFLPVNVVFYGALMDALLAVVCTGLLAWFVVFKRAADRLMFAQLITIMALGGYIYAITIPTVIDRSFSMYILEKIQQQGGGLKQEAFDAHITEEFMREHRLSEARLTEQLESGTITIQNGCVSLTARGQSIASITHWYRQNLLPKHRLLMGSYTDALTDPFAQASQLEKYRCTLH